MARTNAVIAQGWRITPVEAAGIALLWLALWLPWADRAVHMDDTGYLLAAGWINDPAESLYGGSVLFFGSEQERLKNTHPPLLPAYLALQQQLRPAGSERLLHAGQSLFTLLALAAFFLLGRRFTGRPWLCLGLLASSPAFLVGSHSLMTDVPTLGLWLAAVTAFLWGKEQDKFWLRAAAALLLTAGWLTSYYALSVVFLLAFHAVLDRRTWGKDVATLAFPIVAFVGWCAWTAAEYGHVHFFYLFNVDWHPPANRGEFAAALLSFIAGCGPWFFFAVVVAAAGGRRRWLVWPIGAAAACGLTIAYGGGYPWLDTALLAANVALGASALALGFITASGAVAARSGALIGPSERERRVNHGFARENVRGDHLLLAAWLAGVLCYTQLFTYIAARFVLGILPPLILLLVSGMNRWRRAGTAAVVLSLALAVAVAQGDAARANFYRHVVRQLTAGQANPGLSMGFTGEFGLRYYMERAGCRYVSRTETQLPLAFSILHARYSGYSFEQMIAPQLGQTVELRDAIVHSPRWLPRVFTPTARAGFYCHFSGLLPYNFSREPEDVVDVYGVIVQTLEFASDAPPPAIEQPLVAGSIRLAGADADMELGAPPRCRVRLWWEQLAGEPQDAAVEYVLSHPYREITVRQQLSSGIAPEGSRIETRMERLITPLDIPGAYRARVRLLRRSESGGGWRAAGEIELAGALSFPPAFQRSSPPPLPASAPLVAPLGPGVRGTLGPRSATVVSWPDPTPAARLLVLSSLGYALDVPDATAVAEIMVNPGSPDEFAAIIRTGSDTAEWSLTAPANLAQSAHRLAPVAWSWDDGAGQAGAVYWCQVELPAPRAIARIRLRNLTDRATVTFQYIGTCVQP